MTLLFCVLPRASCVSCDNTNQPQHRRATALHQLYPGLRALWETPPLYVVDDFFTAPECDALMALASNYMIASPVVGAGAGEVSESRTSSSCFLAREDLPTVCRKVMTLTGKPIEHLELPQVGWGVGGAWVTWSA